MIKFIKEDQDNKVEISLNREDFSLSELVKEFEFFLRGCGYIFDHMETFVLTKEDDIILSKEEHEELINNQKKVKNDKIKV